MWLYQYGSPVYLQSFIFIWGVLSLLSVKEGKSRQINIQESNILVDLDVVLGVGPLLCRVPTLCDSEIEQKCDSIVITLSLLNLNNLKEIVGKLLLAGSWFSSVS